MRSIGVIILNIFLLFIVDQSYGQQIESLSERNSFNIKGTVRYKTSKIPIKDVSVMVNGGSYTTSDFEGNFNITVYQDDELTLQHPDFETVFYKIVSDDRLVIEVEGEPASKNENARTDIASYKQFNSLIDSVSTYLKKDIEKSIDFVAEALKQSTSASQNAETYEILADVYMYWKQFDLAVSNYKISLQNKDNGRVKIKLGNAYRQVEEYDQSKLIFDSVKRKRISNWESILLYEGYGDIYLAQQKYELAIRNYKRALEIAEENAITPKITNLTSKAAEAYDESGQDIEAERLFSRSMDLAEKMTIERDVEEKEKVANFQSRNKQYSKEIDLRMNLLEQVEDSHLDSIISNESSISPQKQNYKIGNAYYLNNENEKAIPFLEKSIKEADAREDLVVKKDGLKKLSDVYADQGEFNKAKSTFEEYISTVDQLYIIREQEISQAARFSRKIAENQSRINSLEMDKKLSESAFQLSEERGKRQQYIIYSLIGGLLLVLALTYLMYKFIRQQKYANNLLALKSLRSQMNPHFIFNALNSVNSFIASNDERTANKYLSDFSYLMRAVLENSEEDFIPLKKEIELIELYVKLEHFRFKDKFDYSINIDENINLENFEIPPMLLQPYIENAVWHGLRYKKEKGFLKIEFNQINEDLLSITIIDNGIGRSKSKELKTESQLKHRSKGLSNIDKRISILNEMHKDKIDVLITDYQNSDDLGTKVVVTLKRN